VRRFDVAEEAIREMVQLRENGDAQQVKVISSGGFLTAYERVLPAFETTTGIKVTTGVGPSQGNTPDVIGSQLRQSGSDATRRRRAHGNTDT
jgi:hypothetical protein